MQTQSVYLHSFLATDLLQSRKLRVWLLGSNSGSLVMSGFGPLILINKPQRPLLALLLILALCQYKFIDTYTVSLSQLNLLLFSFFRSCLTVKHSACKAYEWEKTQKLTCLNSQAIADHHVHTHVHIEAR